MITPTVEKEVSLFVKGVSAHFESKDTIHSNAVVSSPYNYTKASLAAIKYYSLYSERIQGNHVRESKQVVSIFYICLLFVRKHRKSVTFSSGQVLIGLLWTCQEWEDIVTARSTCI